METFNAAHITPFEKAVYVPIRKSTPKDMQSLLHAFRLDFACARPPSGWGKGPGKAARSTLLRRFQRSGLLLPLEILLVGIFERYQQGAL